MRSNCLRWLALGVLVAVCGAQEPGKVYAPPACHGEKPAISSGRGDTAREEQRQGARDASMLPSAEPMENFELARYQVEDYADCVGDAGCYWADLDAQYRRAEEALKTRVATKKPDEKLAVVMDIDETSLTNYCEMKREDFGYIKKLYGEWESSAASSMPISGGLRLFGEARREGVAVFFITGRPGTERAATARNLKAAGYDGWAGLALREGDEIGMPTIAYKSAERRKITAKGYDIVLSVGDQWSDLLGEPKADVSVKLPNPFYFLP